MGWTGQGLGKTAQGIQDPITAESIDGRIGKVRLIVTRTLLKIN